MKYPLFAFAFCLIFASMSFTQNTDINIIPKPQSVTSANGTFTLNNKTKVLAISDAGRRMAATLNELLQRNYGFKLQTTDKPTAKNVIQFAVLDPKGPPAEYTEDYTLIVSPDFVQISGGERGVFYGLQSLMQILPAEIKKDAKLAACEIKDQPRFGYRGMHLDVGRHFMPVEFVKKYIDLMSQYKFNYFHWHLTEDQGWRIEIKKYPKLTEIGSKRPETMKEKNFSPYVGDGVPHSGFYTQEQVKDVVAYAKARYITVIPEIELPGHSSAALAAYPEFGCKQDYKYKVQTTWGIFKEVYCPTEKTFSFLEDVLTEVIGLFPDSPYIHISLSTSSPPMWM